MDIYKATNNITGKSYIGYAVDGLEERKPEHKRYANRGDGYYFQRAIKKYGWNNFGWILLEHNISDFDILNELERYWIREFDTKRPNGYNLTEGGGGTLGYRHSDKTRRKMCEAKKGRKLSDEHKRKIGEACKGSKNGNYGKQHSEDTKRKISEVHKGKIPWNKGKINCFSEETIRKMCKTRKGIKHGPISEETKRKISESKKGKPLSEETKKKISLASKGKTRGRYKKLMGAGYSGK